MIRGAWCLVGVFSLGRCLRPSCTRILSVDVIERQATSRPAKREVSKNDMSVITFTMSLPPTGLGFFEDA